MRRHGDILMTFGHRALQHAMRLFTRLGESGFGIYRHFSESYISASFPKDAPFGWGLQSRSDRSSTFPGVLCWSRIRYIAVGSRSRTDPYSSPITSHVQSSVIALCGRLSGREGREAYGWAVKGRLKRMMYSVMTTSSKRRHDVRRTSYARRHESFSRGTAETCIACSPPQIDIRLEYTSRSVVDGRLRNSR